MFDDDEYLHDIPMVPKICRGLQRLQQTLTEHLADPKLRSVIFEAVKGCNKHGTHVDFTRCNSENYRKLGFEMEKTQHFNHQRWGAHQRKLEEHTVTSAEENPGSYNKK